MAVMMSPGQLQDLINHFVGAVGAQQQQRSEQGSKSKIRARDMRVQDSVGTAAAWGNWSFGFKVSLKAQSPRGLRPHA